MVKNKRGQPAHSKAPNAKQFVDLAGGPTEVAMKMGIERQAVHKWKQVPPMRVLALEKILMGKKDRYDIRPDLYGKREKVKK